MTRIRRSMSMSGVVLVSACGGAGDPPTSAIQDPNLRTPTNFTLSVIESLTTHDRIDHLMLTSNSAGDMLATWTVERDVGQPLSQAALYHPGVGWDTPLNIPDEDATVYAMMDQQGQAVIMTAYYRLYRFDSQVQQWRSLPNPLATNAQPGELLDALAGSPLLADDTDNGIMYYVVSETADRFRILHLANDDTWTDVPFPVSMFLEDDDTCITCLRISLRRLRADGVGGVYLVFEARRSMNGIATPKSGLYAAHYRPAMGWHMVLLVSFGGPEVADAFSSKMDVDAAGDALLVWSLSNVSLSRPAHRYAQFSQGQWTLGGEPFTSPEGSAVLVVKKHPNAITVLFDDLSRVHVDSSAVWTSHDQPTWKITRGVDGVWLDEQRYLRIFENGTFSILSDSGWTSQSSLQEVGGLSWLNIPGHWTYSRDQLVVTYHDRQLGQEGLKDFRWSLP